MESQPQNPEFRDNPENFHSCNKHPKEYSSVWQTAETLIKCQILLHFILVFNV